MTNMALHISSKNPRDISGGATGAEEVLVTESIGTDNVPAGSDIHLGEVRRDARRFVGNSAADGARKSTAVKGAETTTDTVGHGIGHGDSMNETTHNKKTMITKHTNSARQSSGYETSAEEVLVTDAANDAASESVNTGSGLRKVYSIDFETYYDAEYSVDKLGLWHYVRNERFDAYVVAIVELLPDGTLGRKWVGAPKEIPWMEFTGALLVAHNASFDKAVFGRLQELGIIPGECKAEWACTADLAAYLGAPRDLKGAVKELLGLNADKTVRGNMRGVTPKAAKERGWWYQLCEYVKDDAVLCGLLWQKYSAQWPEKERRVSELNRRIGEGGIHVDEDELCDARECLGNALAESVSLIPWRETDKIQSPKAYKRQCNGEGLVYPESLSKDDPGYLKFVARYGDEHPWILAVQRYKELNALEKKLNTLTARVRPDGVAMVNVFKYFGAGTGRFSGAEGFNMQNLPQGEVYGVDLRSLFIPAEGNVFVISDLSQIEARILLYLAGDNEQLGMIQAGMSVYDAHARKTLGYTGTEPLKTANPRLYALAKSRVLGLGYGCGAETFRALAKSLADVELSPEEAARQVEDFRRQNYLVVQLWKGLNDYIPTWLGRDMRINLRSGRSLVYRGVHTEGGNYCARVQGKSMKLYGGLLTENMVQATARDAFAEMMLKVAELPGAQIRVHVHDELVTEVPAAKAEEYREEINRTMSTPPAWLEGCPLAAETSIRNHYTK